MIPIDMPDATRILAESQDQYYPLAIRDEMIDGVNCMTSVWELAPADIANLVLGGTVTLTIMGNGHPPVRLETQPPEDFTHDCHYVETIGYNRLRCKMCGKLKD